MSSKADPVDAAKPVDDPESGQSRPGWRPWPEVYGDPGPEPGSLRVWPGMASRRLGNRRDVVVWLPPGWQGSGRSYPVIFAHDGQNLFDEGRSFAGSWGMAETMARLAGEGLPAVLVGVANAGRERIAEYSPFPHRKHGGGRGDDYLAFLIETVRPRVLARFPVRRDPAHTGLLGSSMGGLISLYGAFRHPHVFGLCGAMSPSLWFGGRRFRRFLRRRLEALGGTAGLRVYLDVGTRERAGQPNDRPGHFGSWRYAAGSRRLARRLRRHGFVDGRNLLFVEEEGGIHSELAWRRRLPGALRFLLATRR